MKNLLSIALVLFVTFAATAQKPTKWIENRASTVSKDMQTVLSLTDEQTSKVYDEEVKKLVAINKYKKENDGKKPSSDEFKKIVNPFVSAQADIVGGKKKMNKYWAYAKEKRAKEKK